MCDIIARVIGSDGIAALLGQIAFWVMVALGVVFGEIGRKATAVFLCLWAIGWFVLPRLSPLSGVFVPPYLAVLDIVLAFFVFKGDVRLS